MIRFSILILIILTRFTSAVAQDSAGSTRHWSHYVHVGYNLGALAPISLPNNIRKINSYSPGFAPSFGYEVNYRLKGKWSIGAGVRADWKSMRVSDSVQYFHTLVSINNSSLEGDFSGTNVTEVQNVYISMPINAVFNPNNHWRFKAGVYFAALLHPSFSGYVANGYLRKDNALGEKVTISRADFEFDKQLRRFDFGFHGGAECSIYRRFAIKTDLNWGLLPAFPGSFTGISFKMYNIFATIGLSYKIAN